MDQEGLGWDGFGFGQEVFGWGLDCKWTQVDVIRLGWDVTVVTQGYIHVQMNPMVQAIR